MQSLCYILTVIRVRFPGCIDRPLYTHITGTAITHHDYFITCDSAICPTYVLMYTRSASVWCNCFQYICGRILWCFLHTVRLHIFWQLLSTTVQTMSLLAVLMQQRFMLFPVDLVFQRTRQFSDSFLTSLVVHPLLHCLSRHSTLYGQIRKMLFRHFRSAYEGYPDRFKEEHDSL